MKTLLAGILGGVVAFVWSSIVHMAPATCTMGLSILNEKEDAVLSALKANVPQSGLYFFPGLDLKKTLTKDQEDAWTAKYKAGPVGLLLYRPSGADTMTARQLVVEFAATLICGVMAAILLASTVGSFAGRALKVASLGLFTWLAVSVSQWNWYAFPFSFIALDAIDQVIGWLLAGLLMAKMIKPAVAARG